MNPCIQSENIKRIEDKIDNHISVYAKNGKELQRLADLIQLHIESSKEYRKKREERDKEIDVWIEPIKTISNGRKMILYFAGFVASLGALYLMVKEILHK